MEIGCILNGLTSTKAFKIVSRPFQTLAYNGQVEFSALFRVTMRVVSICSLIKMLHFLIFSEISRGIRR